jgi:RNA polymerase sigma factor (sigma-70 family)
MAELTEADRYLLEQIARGNPDGWSQLVARYQGRLLAFARARLPRRADAEDLVQDTFATFLQSFRAFRPDASVETFLFTILRRRLIDVFRGRGTGGLRVCSIQDAAGGGHGADESSPVGAGLAAPEATASWYVRRDEQSARLAAVLGDAIDAAVGRLKQSANFRDLRIIDLLFHAQVRNKEAASLCGMGERQVAAVKHRCLKEIRTQVEAALGPAAMGGPGGNENDANWDALDAGESLLTQVWESRRPTCPKRSTLGRYLLNTLEPDWRDYVKFHVDQLGCRFCQANLEDLQRQDAEEPRVLRDRIFHSTVGFLSRPGG